MIGAQPSFAPGRPSFVPGMDDREDEDTIEIQLAPTQIERLNRAFEEGKRERAAAEARIPVLLPPIEPGKEPVRPQRAADSRSTRLYLAASGGAILLALCVTIAYQLGAHVRPTPPPGALPARTTAPARVVRPVQPEPPPPVIQQQTTAPVPVRFTNPFDNSEVFEFPPGTSPAEARDAVAALLMKRAQERQTSLRSQNGRTESKDPGPSFAQRT